MLQVLFSMFPAYLFWCMYDTNGLQFLQVLAVFMILGIGADDCFVLMDAWKQAKHELDQGGQEASVVDFFAMFATTMTTAVAFLLGITSPVGFIRDFSIF